MKRGQAGPVACELFYMGPGHFSSPGMLKTFNGELARARLKTFHRGTVRPCSRHFTSMAFKYCCFENDVSHRGPCKVADIAHVFFGALLEPLHLQGCGAVGRRKHSRHVSQILVRHLSFAHGLKVTHKKQRHHNGQIMTHRSAGFMPLLIYVCMPLQLQLQLQLLLQQLLLLLLLLLCSGVVVITVGFDRRMNCSQLRARNFGYERCG